MKRIVLVLLLITAACGKEDKISPADADTFIRYFNGGNNDVAQAIVETPDHGLVILATTEIKPNELTSAHYKIKLIKTDQYGNQLWQKFYPDFSTKTGSYKGSGLFLMADGSVAVTGTSIDAAGVSHLLIFQVTTEKGEVSQEKIFKYPENMSGTSVTVNRAGEFVLVGYSTDPAKVQNTLLLRLGSDLDSAWSSEVGDGPATLINKSFLASSDDAILVGGTNQSSTNSVKILNYYVSGPNAGGPVGNPPGGTVAFTFFGNDFCPNGEQLQYIGQTDQKSATEAGDFDIMLYVVSPLSFQGKIRTFPLEGDGADQNEIGNSICNTREGGLLLLGTVNSQGNFGKGGKDYYLIKLSPGTDVDRDLEWTKFYGSKFDDNGVQVIQANDGGFVLLGTTTLANLKTVMLLKTDSKGNIQ